MEGECGSQNVIYEAEVKAEDSKGDVVEVNGWDFRTYQGQAMKFKQRWYAHNSSFNDPTKVLTRKSKDGAEVKVSIEDKLQKRKKGQN